MDSIIFDVDGTLWDSTEIVARAWQDYLKSQHNIEISITAERLKSLFGQLLIDIAKQLLPFCTLKEQEQMIEGCCEAEHAALLKEPAPLYPLLEETLKTLSGKYPLFIVSNCQAGYIEVFLQATGLYRYFHGHLCPGDTGVAKAENLRLIKEKYHLKSPVYVGDTMGDFQACRKAGIPFIFASYGFGDVPVPDATINAPIDLLSLCGCDK